MMLKTFEFSLDNGRKVSVKKLRCVVVEFILELVSVRSLGLIEEARFSDQVRQFVKPVNATTNRFQERDHIPGSELRAVIRS